MGSNCKQLEQIVRREKAARRICAELNNPGDLKNSLLTVIRQLRELTAVDAAGIRVHDSGDYPYYAHDGFPEAFIQQENSLCARNENGKKIDDSEGNGYRLECRCGAIIRGNFDPSLPYFTAAGSFCANHPDELTVTDSEEGRFGRARNHCRHCGYQSMVLIPLKYRGECFGLLQLNDHRPDMFQPDLIEYLEMIGEQLGVAVQNAPTGKQLREDEELNRTLFEYNPVQTVVVDREGRVTMCNWAKRNSGDRHPRIGDLMYRDYAGRHTCDMRSELQQCIASGVGKDFPELQYDDKYLEIKISPFAQGAIITAQNITRAKNAERELRQKTLLLEARLKELDCLYQISDMIQMASGPVEAVFIPILNQLVSAYQYPEIASARIWYNFQEYRSERFQESAWQQACQIGNVGAMEVFYREDRPTRDEGPFLTEERKLLNAVASRLGRFIERTLAQAALHESEQRFKSLAEMIEEVFWIAEPKLARMIYVSPGYERVWGRSPDSLYADPRSFMAAIHPDDREKAETAFNRKASGFTFDVEYRILHPDGSIRWIRDRGFPHPDGEYYVGSALDITAGKEAEFALRDAYGKVAAAHEELVSTRHSERLAFTGRIAASIAHEIRNPSTNVSLALQQLSQTFNPQGPQKEYVEIIEKNINRINGLITELLNCARPPELHMEPHNIHELLEEVLESVSTKIRAQKIVPVKKFHADPAVLKVDKKHMERALLNLILNAIEAMPRQGGRLTVATESSQKNLLIKIADTGKGIAEENIIKIFDPFFSSKPTGVGLGLTTCYGVIVSHGGTIEVESKPSKGSLFTVVLPVVG